jgi:hypothetical protein
MEVQRYLEATHGRGRVLIWSVVALKKNRKKKSKKKKKAGWAPVTLLRGGEEKDFAPVENGT